MREKRIVLRPIASSDFEGAIEFYALEAGVNVATAFIDAVEGALEHIVLMPSSGSLRYATALGVAGLRCWPLQHYPFLIFYLDQRDHIDVWRVLHASRDVPASLRDSVLD